MQIDLSTNKIQRRIHFGYRIRKHNKFLVTEIKKYFDWLWVYTLWRVNHKYLIT